ncbi:MAG: ABC transporter substrate-binding protein [Erysipelotrichaceae bacterium]|nr:ABC transporter substrate-binding protein [Erysipelotrichaceae bacterium]MDY5251527.1 ABC transporter substrate-binding protein [Erysipelotrichaceae bacterium]
MKFSSFFKGGLAVLLAASMVGCTGSPDTSGTTTTTSTDGATTITLGSFGPLEGDYSVYGIAVNNGVDMAIKDYNEANGANVKFASYDTKGDATEAINAFNKLVDEDKVTAIVGGTLSGESTAVATASQASGIPIITPSGTAKDITLAGPNVFRGCYTDPYQAKTIANFAYDDLGATTAAILYNTSDDYSKGLMENFTATFEEKGGKVVTTEGYATGDVDFNTQLTKIAAADADVLFVPNYYKDDALIAKQAKALGIESTIIGGDGWDGVLAVVENPADVEGVIFVNHYSPDDEVVSELTTRYKETYGVDANAFSVLAYDTTMCVLQAIEEAGSTDAATIIEKLSGISFDGILGHMEFDENGDPIKDLSYIQIKDGQYVTYGK